MSKHIIKIKTNSGIRTASVSPYLKDDELKVWTKVHTKEFKFKKEPEYLLTLTSPKLPSARTISETLLNSPKWSAEFMKEAEAEAQARLEQERIAKTIKIVDEVDEVEVDEVEVDEVEVDEVDEVEVDEVEQLPMLKLRALAKRLGLQNSHITKSELQRNVIAKLQAQAKVKQAKVKQAKVKQAKVKQAKAQAPQAPQAGNVDVASMFNQLDASQLEAMASMLNMLASGKK